MIQWIPGHVGVEGNEKADVAAKDATTHDQKNIKLSKSVINNAISESIKKAWVNKHAKWQRRHKFDSTISRHTQTELSRYRTGHSLLLKTYRFKIGKEDNDTCDNCNQEAEDQQHHLFRCPKWTPQRNNILGCIVDIGEITLTQLLEYMRTIGAIPMEADGDSY